jgi:micrococcal nuclease
MRPSLKLFITPIILSLLLIPALSAAEAFTVKHVDDGDTIICENRDITIRVRLAGINAPETGRNKKDADQPFSQEAKLVLEKLVLNKVVDIKGYGLDDYNRLLAVVNCGGKNINLEMIRQGMAEVYKGSPPDGFNTCLYRKAEKEAKGALIGIWSQGDKYISPSQWRRTNREN